MNFRRDDPGAVQFGNFINYYKFNSAAERLKLLPTHVWQKDTLVAKPEVTTDDQELHNDNIPYLVLDVGCNSGVFTQLLWQFLSEFVARPVHILGVDIDSTLIERAQATNNQSTNVTFATVDVMDKTDFKHVEEFLQKHERYKFDVICCFSITMWIHLNHHDSGLQYFLRTLATLAELFVVEPQPWKCYQTAERRMKKAGDVFPLFMELKWRSQVEEEIQKFMENKLERRKIFECCPTKWKRRICFYR